MQSVNESSTHIVDMNNDRLKIGVCYDDILLPSSTDKHNYRHFIKYLNKICNTKRIYKGSREARELQKQYDANNIGITLYIPRNRSKITVYRLKPEYYTDQIYKDIGTDPINI